MDSRDLLIIGGLGVAAWFGYRWWVKRPAGDQAQKPKTDVAAAAASSMTNDAARNTVYGGRTLLNRLLNPSQVTWAGMPVAQPRPPGGAIPPPNTTGPDPEMVPDPVQRTLVMQAVLGPLPVAPSPNANRYSDPNGAPAVGATMPVGSPPQPGDPTPTFSNLYQMRRGIL